MPLQKLILLINWLFFLSPSSYNQVSQWEASLMLPSFSELKEYFCPCFQFL